MEQELRENMEDYGNCGKVREISCINNFFQTIKLDQLKKPIYKW